eukprot:jgi/Hompol1/5575/HPOL_000427-RA
MLLLTTLSAELATAKENRLSDAISRSLGEMGRIYVKTRRYKDAIAAFEDKLPHAAENSLERAWLCHDLGRCYLEVKHYEKAAELGEMSMMLADALKDRRWGLNARVLVAQAQVQVHGLGRAIECYEAALAHAKELVDDPASHAISKVLEDLRRQQQEQAGLQYGTTESSDELGRGQYQQRPLVA